MTICFCRKQLFDHRKWDIKQNKTIKVKYTHLKDTSDTLESGDQRQYETVDIHNKTYVKDG